MISNEDLNKIIKDCAAVGCQITVRDISFLLLCRIFDDIEVAYKSIFGNSVVDLNKYNEEKRINFLRSYIETNFPLRKSKRNSSDDEITFEENKAGMMKLITDTRKALEEGKIDPKDAYKIEADLRSKLNDKFDVKEEVKDQVVQVLQKYDSICPHCMHEVASKPISKEDAKRLYNLVEKK